ncbi:MAG: Flp pilus assembly protein CpaB [Firmicutes bacterium]|nr:Flp pilus assembly protein CpaB [Bacillota bacterium]
MKGGKFTIVLALIPGLLAAVMTYVYVNNAAKPKPVNVKNVPVVAAKATIPPRTRITPDMIYIKEVPEAAVHARAAREAADVVGLFTRYEILEGEPIVMDRLFAENEPVGLASSVPRDKRAVTIPVNEVVGVAGFVKPGDHVDVVVTVSGNEETGNIAFTVLEDVEVLAVAQDTEDKNQGKAKVSTSVTLAVTPSEAEKLALAEDMGNLRLALRPLVASVSKSSGIVARDLLREVKGWSPPRPAGEGTPRSGAPVVSPGDTSQGPAVTITRQAPPTPVAHGPSTLPPQPAGQPIPEPEVVEVIKGTQRTFVTLGDSGEATKQ